MRLKRTPPRLLGVTKRGLSLLFSGLGHGADHGISGGHSTPNNVERQRNVGRESPMPLP